MSVSRSIFPLINDVDRSYFGLRGQQGRDQVGVIDGFLHSADRRQPDNDRRSRATPRCRPPTVMLTIPTQLGVDYNSTSSTPSHVAGSGMATQHRWPVEGAILTRLSPFYGFGMPTTLANSDDFAVVRLHVGRVREAGVRACGGGLRSGSARPSGMPPVGLAPSICTNRNWGRSSSPFLPPLSGCGT